jgi:hypothetical protein
MDTLNEFKTFYEKTVQYEDLVKGWINAPPKYSEEIEKSRTELQRYYPRLARQISRYSGYKPVGYAGIEINVFNVAFDSIDQSNCKGKLNALNEIKGILNKAIGILEAEGESWGSLSKIKTSEQTKSLIHKGKKTKYQKTWQLIDKHRVLSLLGALASIATIVGAIIACLNYLN